MLVGEDLRRCHATLVTGLPYKDVMLPVRPGRARRGPGNPESAPLKSRAVCASSKDTVEEKLMGIKYDYKQTAPRRSRTTAPWQRSWGEVSLSLWRANLLSPHQPPAWSRTDFRFSPLNVMLAVFLFLFLIFNT